MIGKLVIPPRRDPRYLQLVVLIAYAFSAREYFHFERSHWVTLLCCATAVLLDVLFGYFKYRKILLPLSALIIGLASSLLIDARSAWFYVAAAALGSGSKALITYRGRHYFNPANFGVAVLLLLFPRYVTGIPSLFSGFYLPSVVFGAVGALTVIYARQNEISFSWILGFLGFALVRAGLKGVSPVFVLAPMLGPAFLLFSFHMISDPATTPRTTRYRIAFGLAVAAVDAVLRYLEVPHGIFFALLAVSALTPWIRDREGAPASRAG